MTLKDLAGSLVGCAARVIGSSDVVVDCTSEDSRVVRAGTLFVARRGRRSDGLRYAAQALEGGASAVLCEAGVLPSCRPRIEINDLKKAWGMAAQALAGHPTHALSAVGITGTNGKTTVASLVAQVLAQQGRSVARSGTLGFFVGDVRVRETLTTPQPDVLAEMLALARDRGATDVVLEVSSHALDQGRVSGLAFEVAALTNLSQDHLDYHRSMDDYGAAKARLFREHAPRHAVLNLDDVLGRTLFAEVSGGLGVSARGAVAAAISAVEASFERQGIRAQVRAGGQVWELRSALLGRHNLENLLVTWGIAASLGLSHEEIVGALAACRGVPGRLERCDDLGDDIVVVVDYAHTEDALRRALSTLQELDYPALTCVFGCGGDRDKQKRAPMGRVAGAHADRIFLTSDNPRTEDPEEIVRQVAEGLRGAEERSTIVMDRREAIRRAILGAQPESVVLVAGKGHEDYQLVGDRVLPFDDRVEARAALLQRRQERA